MANIEEAERRIEENLRAKNTTLDLSKCNITGEEKILEKLQGANHILRLKLDDNIITNILFLSELTQIERLYLKNNKVSDISFIENWKNLKHLDLSSNLIIDYSPIQNLNKLQGLFLSFNQILDYSFIQNLTSVQSLSLFDNKISDISFLSNLKILTNLNLSFNQISDISVLKELKQLRELHLSENKISDISALKKLEKLEILYLNENKILDLLALKELRQLKGLHLSDNRISDILSLKKITNLQVLTLWNNKISDISVLKELKQLRELFLTDNRIENISLEFLNCLPDLKELYLGRNDIKNIPRELYEGHFNNCLEAVKNHLKSIEKEEERRELNEAKLIFVGVGEVGKTELSEALSEIKYEFKEGRKSTTGIRVKPWQLVDCKREEKKISFIAHIWDFAGQEINYGTHQFFLTKNSIYVFVWETRKGEDESKFAYWLRIVSLLSKNAPILVVQNKIDEIVSEVNQKQWKEQFDNIIGFYKTSCKEGTGINELRTDIQNQLIELPHTREIWNKYRVAVRDELVEMSKETDYISYKDYLKVCEKHTVSKEDAGFLSDQLHNIGSILHFSEEARLKNTVVLNSEWVTDAAYLLLDTKKVTNGRFDFDNLDTIWSDERFDEKHEFLINLIEKFELIFQFQDSDLYIVPEGLPVEEPTGVAEIKPTFESEKTKYLRFEYHYPFMPKGILSRFICRLHENILEEYFWKNGVVLELDKETFAKVILNEVENPKTIKIEVWGKQADKLLAIIRRNIEHIHSKFEELEVFQKIPCVCVDCKDSSKPHLHDYSTLKRFQEKGRTTRECAIGAEDVEIATLLEGIVETDSMKTSYFLELLERNEIDRLFIELQESKLSNKYDINSLKDEYIDGTKDPRFIKRLRVLLSGL
ncbi:COR domain-containing protein [Bernardetia sp. OM2101]|uniref:leucine-rich repeat domain-containing protein n=1 Tax=Bernardetia sp. OM2101 TaxID=3344876 RepID=UPI0035D06098